MSGFYLLGIVAALWLGRYFDHLVTHGFDLRNRLLGRNGRDARRFRSCLDRHGFGEMCDDYDCHCATCTSSGCECAERNTGNRGISGLQKLGHLFDPSNISGGLGGESNG